MDFKQRWYAGEAVDIPTFKELEDITGTSFDENGNYIGPRQKPDMQLVVDLDNDRKYFAPKEYDEDMIDYARAKRFKNDFNEKEYFAAVHDQHMGKVETAWASFGSMLPALGRTIGNAAPKTLSFIAGLTDAVGIDFGKAEKAALKSAWLANPAVLASNVARKGIKATAEDYVNLFKSVRTPEGQMDVTARTWRQWANATEEYLNRVLPPAPENLKTNSTLFSAFELTGQVGGSLIIAALASPVGGLPAVATIFGGMQFHDLREEYLAKGYSLDSANLWAFMGALAEGGLEAIGFKHLVRFATIKNGVRNHLISGVIESLQEMSQQLSEELITNVFTHVRDERFVEALANIAVAGLAGFLPGAGFSVATQSFGIRSEKMADAAKRASNQLTVPQQQNTQPVPAKEGQTLPGTTIAQELQLAKANKQSNELYEMIKTLAADYGITEEGQVDLLYAFARNQNVQSVLQEDLLNGIITQISIMKADNEKPSVGKKEADKKAIDQITYNLSPESANKKKELKNKLVEMGYDETQAEVSATSNARIFDNILKNLGENPDSIKGVRIERAPQANQQTEQSAREEIAAIDRQINSLNEQIKQAKEQPDNAQAQEIASQAQQNIDDLTAQKQAIENDLLNRGSIAIGDTVNKIVLGKYADISTVQHELMHHWINVIRLMAANGNEKAQALVKQLDNIIAKHLNDPMNATANREAEVVTEAFEKWLALGNHGNTAEEIGLFEQIKQFFQDVYDSVQEITGIDIDPEIDSFFRQMTGLEPIRMGDREFGGPQEQQSERAKELEYVRDEIKLLEYKAHEWFHALDYHFGNLVEGRDFSGKNITDATSEGKARKEVYDAFQNLVKKMKEQPITKEELDKREKQFIEQQNNRIKQYIEYYILPTYREGERKENVKKILEKELKKDLWTMKDVARIYEAISLRKNAKMKMGLKLTDKEAALIWISSAKDRIQKVKTLVKATKDTKFLSDAKKLDKAEKKAYWTANTELGARAFTSYIIDKLSALENRNDFLAKEHGYAIDNEAFSEALKKDPNANPREFMTVGAEPHGKERAAINQAFDKLFETIKVRETDKGLTLYQGRKNTPLQREGADYKETVAFQDKKDIFQADKDISKNFSEEVRKAISDKTVDNKELFYMGKVPAVYNYVGAPIQDLKTNKLAMRKAMGLITPEELAKHKDWHNHNVPYNVIDNLVALVSDPIAIFRSNNKGEERKLVAVLDAKYKGQQITAILSPNLSEGGYTFIPTAFERDDFERLVNLTNKKNNILYVDEKRASKPGLSGLTSIIGENALNNSILTKEDIVKGNFILVDGKKRSTRNSEGNLIHETVAGLRNFYKWFGDSKVVDENGNPLVVYHGTNAENIQQFDRNKARNAYGSRNGFFFAKREKDAGYGHIVMPVYLSMQNPYMVDVAQELSQLDYDIKTERNEAEAAGYPISRWEGKGSVEFEANDSATAYLDDNYEEIFSRASEGNYDGVIVKGLDGSETYVAFEPTQIKSVYNRGTFDPEQANIYYQERKAQQTADKAGDRPYTREEMASLESQIRENGVEMYVPESHVAGSFGESVKDILINVRQRAGAVSPRLKAFFDKLDFWEVNIEGNFAKHSEGWLKKYQALSETDKRILDFRILNHDVEGIEQFNREHDMTKEYQEVRTLLNHIYAAGNKAGLDMKYLNEYFPTDMADYEGFMTHIKGTDKWTYFERAFREIDPNHAMDDQERAKQINLWLRGHGTDPVRNPDSAKARTILRKDRNLMKFYASSDKALMSYLHAMSHTLAVNRAYGKGSGFNTDETIGAIVNDLIQNGTITYKEEAEVKKLLKARLSFQSTPEWIASIKNIGYLGTMNNITSAVTQLGDLYAGFYKYGFSTAMEALFGKKEITKKDLGLDSIWEEFTDKSKTGWAVEKLFKAIGLEKLDAFGKMYAVQASWINLQKQAKANNPQLTYRLTNTFGKDALSVLKDIKAGNITDDVKVLLWSDLADTQPIGRSGVPAAYLNSPHGRIFYQLKTFFLNQVSLFYADSQLKIQRGIEQKNKKLFLEGVQNGFKLILLLTAFNAGADVLKNLIMGRKIDIKDTLVSNALWNLGVSKYTFFKGKREGYATALWQQYTPPQVSMVDDIVRDSVKMAQGKRKAKDSALWSFVPVFGRPYYWWFGGGHTQQIEKEKKERKAKRKKRSR